MTDVKLKTSEVNGKKIAYSTETEFLLQVSRGKGSYRTVARYKGDLAEAVRHFNVLDWGGYNRRLLMPSCERKPVLVRVMSWEQR